MRKCVLILGPSVLIPGTLVQKFALQILIYCVVEHFEVWPTFLDTDAQKLEKKLMAQTVRSYSIHLLHRGKMRPPQKRILYSLTTQPMSFLHKCGNPNVNPL